MEGSELVAEALGEHVFEYFIRNKRARVGRLQGAGHPVGARPLPRVAVAMDAAIVEPLLVFPDPPPPLLAQTLDLGGLPVEGGRRTRRSRRSTSRPTAGRARSSCADEDPEGAFGICRALRKRDAPLEPVLLLVSGAQLAELELREDLFDDFCLTPFHPKELEARLRHLFWRTGPGHAARDRRVRRPRAQPRDLPGRARRHARSTSPTWSTSC